MPALLYIKANGDEFKKARAMWKKDSTEYVPALGERVWAMKSLYTPVFLLVFGLFAMLAGVATTVLSALTQTKA